MEALFKKYFWVVNLLALSVVAYLLAQTVVDFLATKYLTVKPEAVVIASSADEAKMLTKADGGTLGQVLSARNPFNVDPKKADKPKDPDCKAKCEGKVCGSDGCEGTCGECGDGEQCNGEGQCEQKSEKPKECEMNVELVGTLVNPYTTGERFAQLTVNGSGEMVEIGTEVNGKATVVDIQPKIIFLREGNNLCHVGMWQEKKAPKTRGGGNRISGGRGKGGKLTRPKPGDSAKPRPGRSPNRGVAYDYSQGVKKQGAYEYKIDRQMLDEQLTDLTQLGMQARVIPNYRKGKYEGFKLVGVRPGSLYRAIGIRSGDIIRSISGKAINSPNKAMELFNQLKSSNAIELQIERRGKLETFNYTIQ